MRYALVPVALVLSSCGGAPDLSNPVAAAGASMLHLDYENNEAGADKKYKGKVVEVAGTVKAVNRDASGYHIRLVVAEGAATDHLGVDCYLLNSEADKASDLKWPDAVTVRGVCSGRENSPADWRGFRVVFRNCRIEKIAKSK